jgi:hypothetical protein
MDVKESCAGPLPMYEEVKSDLSTLIQLFQAQAQSPFLALLRTVLLVVELRLWLCQWYLLHDPDARSGAAVATTDGPEAQAARQDPFSTLTTQIQRLQKEQSSRLLLPWKEVMLAESKMVASSLQTVTLLNHYSSDLLFIVVELLRLRKALRQWEDDAAKQPPGGVIGAPRRQILRQQFQHLVNKLPLRFHGVADQVMSLSQYNTELLGLALSSSSLSPRLSSSSSSSSNPYIGLIAQFLLSYGPTALVCVASFMQSQAVEEGESDREAEHNNNSHVREERLAYALPRAAGSPATPSQRQDIVSREFVPIFSMTSGQAAAASSSKQHSSSVRHPTSSSSFSLVTESPMGRPSSTASSSSLSNVPGVGTTVAGSERGGPSTTSFSSSSLPVRRDHGPPAWFWELCHHSGLWPAVEGRLPEGGAQRFSLLGAGGGGGVSGRKSPLEGTFVHQSGRHHIFTYFVAHISPQERLVVAFGDRNRPATDRVVLSFLMAATSILNDSMAFGV